MEEKRGKSGYFPEMPFSCFSARARLEDTPASNALNRGILVTLSNIPHKVSG